MNITQKQHYFFYIHVYEHSVINLKCILWHILTALLAKAVNMAPSASYEDENPFETCMLSETQACNESEDDEHVVSYSPYGRFPPQRANALLFITVTLSACGLCWFCECHNCSTRAAHYIKVAHNSLSTRKGKNG